MHKKLILILIGLILLLGGGMAGAREKQDTKTGNKSSMSSRKCWEHTWVISEALKGRSTMPVCKAFEEVLNTTCEPPEKLRCNWTLPAGEKRFKKLIWKQIDLEAYRGLIEDMALGKDSSKERWNTKDPQFKKAFEEGRIKIKMTPVDIDGDGATESLVHQNWRVGCPARGGFGVIDSDTKRLDWRFRQLLLAPNSDQGAEIMLYNDKAYMFGWDDAFKILMVYEGFYVNAVNSRGYQNICQFKYIKGDKP